MGYEAVKQLAALKNCYNTTVFDLKTKQSEKLLSPFQDDINIVYGDITNKQNVCKAVQNTNVVIHLAALIPPVADEKPDLAEKINVGGTRNLIECLEEYATQAFFMYSSSISIYGDRIENPWISVGDPLKPSVGDEYAKTKIKCEQLIQQSKLNWTIFRLAAIMGKHKISKLMFHMPLNTPMEIATTADTARAFVSGIEKKTELSKQIFNLGGGSQCRILYKDFLQKAFEINGLGKLDFPEGTFAKQNFHCGYYMDGDDLIYYPHFFRPLLVIS